MHSEFPPAAESWPHVTEVLSRAGLIETEWFRSFDLARGSALHAATHYLDEGDLDWKTVDPVISGRLRSYQQFLSDLRPENLLVEERVHHPLYRYQGRLDRLVCIGGRHGVLDLKGPSKAAWQGLQLAAYAACFGVPLARWSLHLSDERYLLVEHRERTDWGVFTAALSVVSWRKKHGL